VREDCGSLLDDEEETSFWGWSGGSSLASTATLRLPLPGNGGGTLDGVFSSRCRLWGRAPTGCVCKGSGMSVSSRANSSWSAWLAVAVVGFADWLILGIGVVRVGIKSFGQHFRRVTPAP
jgi:hypothetical protein